MIFRYASMRSAVRICCWDAEDRSGASSRLLGTFFLAGSHVLNGSVFKGLFLTRKPPYFIGKPIVSGEVFPLNQSIDQHGSTSQCHKMLDFVSGHVAAMQPSHLEIQGSYGIRYPHVSSITSCHFWSLPRCPKSVLSMTGVLSPGLILTPLGDSGLPSAACLQHDWKAHFDKFSTYHTDPYGSIRIHTDPYGISMYLPILFLLPKRFLKARDQQRKKTLRQ